MKVNLAVSCLVAMLHRHVFRRCFAWTCASQVQMPWQRTIHHGQTSLCLALKRQVSWANQLTSMTRKASRLGFSSETIHPSENESEASIIPITVLSGFLGSGKTTLLQHMLNNNEGLKIAVIVNDVASVNIDSKLLRGQSTAVYSDNNLDLLEDDSNDFSYAAPAGIVELQNGCACCSLSGELLTSVSELLTLSDMRHDDEKFDHIVVEMSGVAEPRSVRNIFQEAIMYDMPLMERVRLDTLVTVVDCSTYFDYIKSSRAANTEESPELFYRDRDERDQEKGKAELAFWMEPSLMLSDAEGGVCDLLVEQTEVADVILLNKIDLLDGKTKEVKEIVTALNPRAKVLATSFGQIDRLGEILAFSKGNGVAIDGVVDDHKDFVKAADTEDCSDPRCTNPLHNHDHSSHSHHDGHSRSGDLSSDCNHPTCDDHSHSHSHESKDTQSTATHAGIGSFVYRARRPFHPARILSVIQKLPIVRGAPSEEAHEIEMSEITTNAFQQVLRSKGFAWTADSNVKALYWSHAGTSFEMQCLGRWWSTLPRNQWPKEATEAIISDFDDANHEESSTSTTVGDRRQEIVFIGPGLASQTMQKSIKATLDSCLLDGDEWDLFCSKRTDESSLASCFENRIRTRMLT
ncbi:hypothetical protein HJC23_004916 [Cyclotella cryptica]|uniref:CobW C-terminal domain-containing protein n=1 Tax=Cyclotella cryptica TaxID=29204 RepID=A0ABD3PTJ0_9STRA|eukprot:CCRYP_011868-RA/>CCRYP_011868-RA protein AED:0.06 eAED:0.06 QI:160/1/1/1/1/1/3/1133/632